MQRKEYISKSNRAVEAYKQAEISKGIYQKWPRSMMGKLKKKYIFRSKAMEVDDPDFQYIYSIRWQLAATILFIRNLLIALLFLTPIGLVFKFVLPQGNLELALVLTVCPFVIFFLVLLSFFLYFVLTGKEYSTFYPYEAQHVVWRRYLAPLTFRLFLSRQGSSSSGCPVQLYQLSGKTYKRHLIMKVMVLVVTLVMEIVVVRLLITVVKEFSVMEEILRGTYI